MIKRVHFMFFLSQLRIIFKHILKNNTLQRINSMKIFTAAIINSINIIGLLLFNLIYQSATCSSYLYIKKTKDMHFERYHTI